MEDFCLSGQSQQEPGSQLTAKNQSILPIEVLLWEEDSACAQVLLNLVDIKFQIMYLTYK